MSLPGRAAGAATLLAALSSCHPFGCGSDQCVRDRFYTDDRHCYAVFAVADDLLRWASIKDQDLYASAIPSNATTRVFGGALDAGTAAGYLRGAVLADLERARVAYGRQHPRHGNLSHEQFKPLFNDALECQNGEDD